MDGLFMRVVIIHSLEANFGIEEFKILEIDLSWAGRLFGGILSITGTMPCHNV